MKRFMENKRLLLILVVISGLAYVASQTIILMILGPMGESALMFQLSFDSKSLTDIITGWGDTGIEIFLNHFYMDFPHPVIYGSFMFFLLCYLRSNLPESNASKDIPAYCFLPFAAALLDLVENFLELFIIGRRSNITEGLALANGLLSSTKWALSAISAGIIAIFTIRLILYSRKAREDSKR